MSTKHKGILAVLAAITSGTLAVSPLGWVAAGGGLAIAAYVVFSAQVPLEAWALGLNFVQFSYQIGAIHVSLGDAAVGLVVALGLMRFVLRPHSLDMVRGAGLVFTIFVVALWMDVVATGAHSYSIAKAFEYTLLLLAGAITMQPVYRSQHNLRVLLVVIVACSSALALAALLYFIRFHTSAYVLGMQKNSLGLYLIMGLLVSLGVSFHGVGWVRLLIAGGLVASGSRGSLVGALVGVGAWALVTGRWRPVFNWLAVAVGAGVAAFNVLPALRNFALRRVSDILMLAHIGDEPLSFWNTPIGIRFTLWREAWASFLAHPLWGVGFGRWVGFSEIGGFTNVSAHDVPLSVLAQGGSCVFAATAVLYVWIIVRGGQQARRSKGLAAVYAAIIAAMVEGLADTWWVRGTGFVFFVLVGIIVSGRADPLGDEF